MLSLYHKKKTMSRTTKWLIITIIMMIIIALFRAKAIAPASVLSFILFLAALIEKMLRIQAIRNMNRHYQQQMGGSYPPQGDMSLEEAKELLELSDNPTKKEIKQAYYRLMQRNHPDKGGSKYLAAKINRAKDIVLQHNKEQ